MSNVILRQQNVNESQPRYKLKCGGHNLAGGVREPQNKKVIIFKEISKL